jgi:hypothetical protein
VQVWIRSSLPLNQRPRRLFLHAVLLAGVYLVFLLLLFGLRQPILACVWLLAGLLADCLLWRAVTRVSCTGQVERLTQSLLAQLEVQSSALTEQAGQIARLQAAVTDDALHDRVLGELDGGTQPKLEALVEDLVQAEQKLPEEARQTRAWLHEARRLARSAQADVDAIRLQVAGR